MKLNYFLIPVATIAVALTGSAITNSGMIWYKNLALPPITPPGSVIGIIWTVLFILSAVSLLLFWNSPVNFRNKRLIAGVFIVNGLLNVLWSWLFFGNGFIALAFWDALLLQISVDVLIIMLWRKNRFAASLLFPYAVWVIFASFLNYSIWFLNK